MERRWNAAQPLLRLGRVDEAVALLQEPNQIALFYPLFLCAANPGLRRDGRIREAFRKVNAGDALDALTAVLDTRASHTPSTKMG